MTEFYKQYINATKEGGPDLKKHAYDQVTGQLALSDPELWFETQTDLELNHYQLRINQLTEDPNKAVRKILVYGPRGLGKSFTTGSIAARFIDSREKLGVEWAMQTIAPGMKTLQNVLWPTIHKAVNGLKSSVEGGTKDTSKNLKMRYEGRYGTGVSQTAAPGQEVTLEGIHAPHQLIIFDEAKGIRDAVWDSVPGSFIEAGINGNQAIWIAISTPGPRLGRFYEIVNERHRFPDWEVVHVTPEEAIEAGRINRHEIKVALSKHGEDDATYQNHYMGVFYEDKTNTFMPNHWLEEAFTRHDEMDLTEPGELIAGVDTAGTGKDSYTVAYYSPKLNAIVKVVEHPFVDDQISMAKQIVETAAAFTIDAQYNTSVIEIYRSLTDKPVNMFWGMAGTTWKTRSGKPVRNVRAAGFMNMLEMLDPALGGNLALPRLDRLRADVQAQKVKATMSDVIQFESKDVVKKRINKSPDIADSIAMALFEPPKPVTHKDLPRVSVLDIRKQVPWQ